MLFVSAADKHWILISACIGYFVSLNTYLTQNKQQSGRWMKYKHLCFFILHYPLFCDAFIIHVTWLLDSKQKKIIGQKRANNSSHIIGGDLIKLSHYFLFAHYTYTLFSTFSSTLFIMKFFRLSFHFDDDIIIFFFYN